MGSDERQYSSYPLRINMASIFKDKYYEYKEYHTSNDNLIFTKPENIAEEIYHVAHQNRSAWSFDVEIRPDIEKW